MTKEFLTSIDICNPMTLEVCFNYIDLSESCIYPTNASDVIRPFAFQLSSFGIKLHSFIVKHWVSQVTAGLKWNERNGVLVKHWELLAFFDRKVRGSY